MTATTTDRATDKEPIKRRDFLYLAATAMGVAGAAMAAWPLIDSMEPAADTLAAGGPIDVDLASLQPGQQILVRWRSRPIFILRRTAEDLKILQEPQLVERLRDPDSSQRQQGKYVQNWHRSIKPEYLAVVGICTHLGCIPKYRPQLGAADLGPNWLGGYFCPCHGSRYDLAGRVFKGVPAPYNLPVPPYHFVNDKTLRIGENPPGQVFDFESIEQI
jgi:ubiquinol-cytochrome c reductase iron-sulfur subunit